MELKHGTIIYQLKDFECLNRTFYGIETGRASLRTTTKNSLNRTFYGIETSLQLPAMRVF